MLLIEGPDMVGKTMLADAIAAYVAEWHPGVSLRRDKFGLAESERMVEACEERVKPMTLCDRCWISEVVYGLTLRGQPRITPAECMSITRRFNAVGGMLVLVYSDRQTYDELIRLHHSRGEAFSPSQCLVVASTYYEAATRGWLAATRSIMDARREAFGGDWVMPWINGNLSYEVKQRDGLREKPQTVKHAMKYPGLDESFVRKVAKAYLHKQGAMS